MKVAQLIFILLIPNVLWGQNVRDSILPDSISDYQLNEVVLTGQYERQSVDQSVFEVQVITREEIERMAASDLSDVLNQSLNMNIVPQPGTGSSGIQQFGFNSQYVKILVDNVPVIGGKGFGSAIDISQINLSDIKQIEIVEGSMGVQYGANAVTGVVNIITKKGIDSDWKITAYLQEESIGDEYSWFSEGKHIQSLEIGHNFSKNFFARVSYLREDFQGYKNEHQGIYYFNKENPNDGLRGFEWLPKEQNTVKAFLKYQDGGFQLFYKFEYFTEKTEKYAENVFLNRNNATQTVNPTAEDKIFRTDRFYHHLNASGEIGNSTNFNVSVSFQEQTRNLERYIFTLKTGEKSNIKQYDYNTRQAIFSRGTFNNFFNLDNFTGELGYAVNLVQGTSSGLAIQNVDKNTQEHQVNSYAYFASGEWDISSDFSLRPGFRLITSSTFSPQYAFSLSGSYRFEKGYQLRLILGSSPKLPTFEQLYFYMVDSNHNIQGNENLKPEEGRSAFLHFKKTYYLNDFSIKWTPKISTWYLNVRDKIDLIITDNSPLTYEYNNIDLYKTWGIALRNQFRYNQFTAGLGFAFSGQSKELNSLEKTNDDYLYGFQVNSSLSYQLENSPTTFSAFFKLNGPQYEFVRYLDDQGNAHIRKGKLESYGWLNLSARHLFFDKKLELTVGSRNVLDVTRVKSTIRQPSTHNAGGGASRLLGYGRSYYIKLLYNLNF